MPYSTMNDVPMIVSAGSKYAGTSVVCTPHVSWPSGAAATGVEASRAASRAPASVRTTRREFMPWTVGQLSAQRNCPATLTAVASGRDV